MLYIGGRMRLSFFPGLPAGIRRTAFLLLGAAFSFPARAWNPWTVVDAPTIEPLYAVDLADTLRGWAAGGGGTILHTQDGGRTWTAQETGARSDIADIQMLNTRTGWAIGYELAGPEFGTRVFRTTDGGESWSHELFPIRDVFLTSLDFLDSLRGWMAGESGALYGTTDGGASWQEAGVDTSIRLLWDLQRIRFLNPLYGYASGGRYDITGVIWRTADGGAVWNPRAVGAEPIYDIHYFDSLHVIGIGGDYDFGAGMVRTTDGGIQWEYTYLGVWGQARALAFRTPSEAWVPLGFAQTMMVTFDSGRTWTDMASPDSNALYDAAFSDSLHGIMVGARGSILRYEGGASDVNPGGGVPHPATCSLGPNFPNPFNPRTRIPFEIPERGTADVRVFNILGEEQAVLHRGEVPAGRHTREFDAAGLPSGIYFCRLLYRPGGGATPAVRTRSMLLLR
ncbi:MAG: YCF48-related protein [Bacteroidota bacterium]